MTKTQKELARLNALLATRLAAKEDANNRGDETYFYAMCDAVRETEADIYALSLPTRRSDATTRELITANVD